MLLGATKGTLAEVGLVKQGEPFELQDGNRHDILDISEKIKATKPRQYTRVFKQFVART